MTERPTFSECVIGYRSWKLDDWVLSPVSFGSPWRPGVNKATCKAHDMMTFSFSWSGGAVKEEPPRPKHDSPAQGCSCGLHAYHEMPAKAEGIVVGAVAAWGDLQVHCNGFRAEYAQILALVEAPGLEEVAGLYRVPLVPRAMLTMEAHQHGSPLPESMRPEKPKPVEIDYFGGGYSVGGLYQQFSQQLNRSFLYGSTASYKPSRHAISHTDLWTPSDDVKAEAIDKEFDRLAKYRKAPANRQGPIKPRRAPKDLK